MAFKSSRTFIWNCRTTHTLRTLSIPRNLSIMASQQPTVAYIGLGNMGSGMAKNIALKGPQTSPLVLYNRTASRAESLLSSLPPNKATIVSSINTAVSKSDIIFLSLGSDTVILNTILAALSARVKGKIFVDCSTTSEATTAKLNMMITSQGAHFIAMPIFGSPHHASIGKVVCMPAGPKEIVERILPYCEGVMARSVITFPTSDPTVSVNMKCIGNTLLFNGMTAVAEAEVLSDKSGVGSEGFRKFLEVFIPSYAVYHSRMLDGTYYNTEHPPMSVDHSRKDIGFAMALAEKNGVKLRALEVADQHYKKVQEYKEGMGEIGDVSAIYGSVRMESGLEFENGGGK